MYDRNLDLVAREEAARTSLLAVTETHVVRGGADELPPAAATGLLAELEETVADELFGVGAPTGGGTHCEGRDAEDSAFRQVGAIGECHLLFHPAVHRDC